MWPLAHPYLGSIVFYSRWKFPSISLKWGFEFPWRWYKISVDIFNPFLIEIFPIWTNFHSLLFSPNDSNKRSSELKFSPQNPWSKGPLVLHGKILQVLKLSCSSFSCPVPRTKIQSFIFSLYAFYISITSILKAVQASLFKICRVIKNRQ